METQHISLEDLDDDGFPLPYPPKRLKQMKQHLNISQEEFQNIHNYFDAACKLYAKISLRMLHKIYNSQNPPVSQEDFLAAAKIIAHEQHVYAILAPTVFHEDAAFSHPIDQELVADHLYAVSDEDYYETEEAQEGKPWYIPPRDELLKYADRDYVEKTPQFQAMVDYLKNTQRKLHCPPAEILGEFDVLLGMGSPIQEAVKEGQLLGVRFQNQQDFQTFLRLLLDLSQHTRQYNLRGHTPAELGLPTQSMEDTLEEVTYSPHYQDSLDKMGAMLQANKASSSTVSGKTARNAPCPCGSGRKYKNCCGKGK